MKGQRLYGVFAELCRGEGLMPLEWANMAPSQRSVWAQMEAMQELERNSLLSQIAILEQRVSGANVAARHARINC